MARDDRAGLEGEAVTHAERQKRRRTEARAAGKCGVCCQRPAVGARFRCVKCEQYRIAERAPALPRRVDLKGQRFGRLTVTRFGGLDRYGRAHWFVQCDCGDDSIASGANLRSGNTQSCGCRLTEWMDRGAA